MRSISGEGDHLNRPPTSAAQESPLLYRPRGLGYQLLVVVPLCAFVAPVFGWLFHRGLLSRPFPAQNLREWSSLVLASAAALTIATLFAYLLKRIGASRWILEWAYVAIAATFSVAAIGAPGYFLLTPLRWIFAVIVGAMIFAALRTTLVFVGERVDL